MWEFYSWGWLAAFVIGLIHAFTAWRNAYSVKAKNLAKVDRYVSPWTAQLNDKPSSTISYLMVTFYVLALAPLFSWITVASETVSYFSRKSAQANLPDKAREFLFKLDAFEMSKAQVEQIFAELGDSSAGITLSHGDTDFELFPKESKLVETENMVADHETIRTIVYQYKIDGLKVLVRTIEESAQTFEGEHCNIKDNVVLESQVRERMFGNPHLKFALERLKEAVDWRELGNWKLRHFVLSNHQEVISKVELRKAMRTELERLQSAAKKLSAEVARLGGTMNLEAEEEPVKFSDRAYSPHKTEIEELYSDDSARKFGFKNGDELSTFGYDIAALSEALGEKAPAKRPA